MASDKRFEILVYHRVGAENSFDGLTISKQLFVKQMRFIKKRHNPMLLGDIIESLQNKKALPLRTIAVTFDDGYEDTFKIALPVLRHLKISATVFITTGYIDREIPAYQNAPMLSWRMVKMMERQGIEIGAHTVTHPNLRECNVQEIKNQLVGSKKRLEDKLSHSIRLLAYPYGGRRSFNKTVQLTARQSGFLAACTTLPGDNGPETDLYALRRLQPLQDQIHHMAVQLDLSTGRGGQRSGIQGINGLTRRVWKTRYKKITKLIAQKDLFYWKPGRLSN